MGKGVLCACIGLLLGLVLFPMKVQGKSEADELADADSYLESFMKELDMEELDSYLSKEENYDISFSQLVNGLITGEIPFDGEQLFTLVKEVLWQEVSDNKGLLVTILLLAISCSFVKNFSDIFKNSYISDICFILIYVELMALLMKSFLIMNGLVEDTLGKIVEFMNMLIPVFAVTLCIGMSNLTAAGFYQLAFLIIYIVQWVLSAFLIPMVQILVVVEFMNYMIPGEKFTRMCELIEEGIRWCLKLAVGCVVGLNVIQGMIAPAVDRLKTSAVTKTISVIPGVGNISNALSEMLLGSGMVIKNSVGVAGVIILLLIAAVPCMKLLFISVLYKLTAAVTEPIADKRISGSINGVYLASRLLQKIVFTALVLFVVTIAVIAAASRA